jgi:hypothetical protein
LPPDIPANPTGLWDWAAIAHDYAESALSITELCALHSVSRAALYDRIEAEGWLKRSDARRAATLDRAHAAIAANRKTGLTQRMLLALDHKMTEFETRMKQAATANATAADSERDARTLGTLVRLFDKLKGFGAAAAPSMGSLAAGPPAGKDHHDADSLRHDLARRLQSLRDGIGG